MMPLDTRAGTADAALEAGRPPSTGVRRRTHEWAALAGPAAILITIFAWLFAGILLVPSTGWGFGPVGADWSPDEVHAFFFENATAFRVGVTVSIFSLSGIGIMSGAIGLRMMKAEGGTPILSIVQIIAGTVIWLLLIVPMVFLLVAAFRPDRDPDVLMALNDLAWILLIPPVAPFIVQNVSIALAIFHDESATPIFPRWVAWANLWVSFSFIPGVLSYFFHSGPFAWQGVFSFWLALSAFAVWACFMGVTLFNVLRKEAATRSASKAVERGA